MLDYVNGLYLISIGDAITISNIYQKINKVFDNNMTVTYKKERDGDIKHSVLNNEKMLKLTDVSTTELDIGLQETILYFKANIKLYPL